jgi:hypothetical protein
MTTKSREYLFASSIRVAAERAAEARRETDQIACKAWNMRMLGFKGPAQPSPALGVEDARLGRRRPDGIARASWPMEVHEAPGRARFVALGGDGFFDIPPGALVAEGVDNLFLAGRVVGAMLQPLAQFA